MRYAVNSAKFIRSTKDESCLKIGLFVGRIWIVALYNQKIKMKS